MQLSRFWIVLVPVMGLAAAGKVLANDLAPPAEAKKAASEEEIRALIRQLGDVSTAQRDAAARRLIQIGAPAKPHLEEAIKGENQGIGRRAKMLLLSITRREENQRAQALANGEVDGATLPGWKQFSEIVGDSPETRAFYVKMHVAQRELMEAYHRDRAQAKQLLHEQLNNEQGFFMAEAKVRSPEAVAPILLVVGDRRVDLDSEMVQKICGLLTTNDSIFEAILHSKPIDPVDKPKAAKGTEDNKGTSDKPQNLRDCEPVRKLVGRWMKHPQLKSRKNTAGFLALMTFAVAVDYDLSEGAQLAKHLLTDVDFITAEAGENQQLATLMKYIATLCIAQLGNENDTRALEPLLSISDEVKFFFRADPDANKWPLLLCDAALATMLELRGQNFEDYNFRTKPDYDKKGHRLDRIRNIYFASEADRAEGMKKWNAWSKAHPIKEKSKPAGEKP